jgi:hypothetical protein
VLQQAILESAVMNRVLHALFCHNMVRCAHVYVKRHQLAKLSHYWLLHLDGACTKASEANVTSAE